MRYVFMFLCVFLLSTTVAEDASAKLRISIVNIQQIMKDSVAAKSARQQLNAKQQQFQAELNTREKELKAQNDALVQQSAQRRVEGRNGAFLLIDDSSNQDHLGECKAIYCGTFKDNLLFPPLQVLSWISTWRRFRRSASSGRRSAR